jgi:hypothetical protein
MNRLYFGDNLKSLSDRKLRQSGSDFPDENVDLADLEPPPNSGALITGGIHLCQPGR